MLRLHPRLAPVKAAVFPLVNKDGMPEVAQKMYRDLKKNFNVVLRRQGRGRPPLRPAGRGGDAVLHHGRWTDAAGPDGDDPRPRHAEAVARKGGPVRDRDSNAAEVSAS